MTKNRDLVTNIRLSPKSDLFTCGRGNKTHLILYQISFGSISSSVIRGTSDFGISSCSRIQPYPPFAKNWPIWPNFRPKSSVWVTIGLTGLNSATSVAANILKLIFGGGAIEQIAILKTQDRLMILILRKINLSLKYSHESSFNISGKVWITGYDSQIMSH